MPKNANDDSEYPYSRCLSCHSSDTLRLIDRDGKMEFFSRPLAAYGHEAQNTVGCLDCHDPKTMQLSMRRDYLDKGLVSAGMKEFKDSTHQEKDRFFALNATCYHTQSASSGSIKTARQERLNL